VKGNLSGERVEAGSQDIPEGMAGAIRSTKQRALHVNLRDNDGNELGTASSPTVISGTVAIDQTTDGTTNGVSITNTTIEKTVGAAAGSLAIMAGGSDGTNARFLKTDAGGELQVDIVNALVPTSYDYISLSYTGSNLTGVVYKTGGSGGTTVATLALAYTGARLDSVTKT